MSDLTPWPDFLTQLKGDLSPGDLKKARHFALLAPTRGGKTTLAVDPIEGIIPRIYKDVPVLIVDSTSDPNPPMIDYGEKLGKYGPIKGHRKVTVGDFTNASKEKIYRAIDRAYKQGNVVIYIDEVRQVADPRFFGMQRLLEHIWLFGGKRGIVLGGGTQAPRWVPSAFYDQSKCHFIFRIRDQRSRKRLSEISGDIDTLNNVVPSLKEFEFAYVNPDGDVTVSKLEHSTASKESKLVAVQKKARIDSEGLRMG
jgi:hypothetical protein